MNNGVCRVLQNEGINENIVCGLVAWINGSLTFTAAQHTGNCCNASRHLDPQLRTTTPCELTSPNGMNIDFKHITQLEIFFGEIFFEERKVM